MAVLYRKYRPQTFKDVVGQQAIIKTLQNQVLQGRVSHAYLFTGSRGVGKTSVARILAKAVNCLKSDPPTGGRNPKPEIEAGDACGECGVCKAIENNNFIDLIEIDAASNTGVDNIRDIIEHVKFAPSLGKYKVFIVDEVHMLSKGAFNALLKTLEEPPKHAIFILATTEIQKVPATIISRTQKFDFKALSLSEIKEHLVNISKKENLNFVPEVLDLVAQNAQGSGRDALSILDKISTFGDSVSSGDIGAMLGVTDIGWSAELLGLIATGQASYIPDFFDRLLEKGTDFTIFNKDFLEYLRKALIIKVTGKKINEISDQTYEEMLKNLEHLSLNDLMFVIRLFLKSFKDLQGSPSAEIPMLLAGIEGALKKTPANKTAASVILDPASVKAKINEPEPANLAVNSQVSFVNFDNSSLEEVIEFWPKVVEKIKQQNGPLGSLLKAVNLNAIESGKIILQVKYEFDRKTLEKNSNLIMDAVKEVSGKNLGIAAKVSQQIQNSHNPVAALNDALKIFGGELVE